MANLPFSALSLDQFVGQVLERINDGPPSAGPAFSLVLGSGFSAPLFPTAGAMVERDIAWWKYAKRQGLTFTAGVSDEHREPYAVFAKEMWHKVHASLGTAASFQLHAETGLPVLSSSEDVTNAYQSVMSGQALGGLSTSELRRDYFRALCNRVGKQINLAHLSLGSLLQEQSTPEWADRKRRSFCRTILTTNFDPLLQRALQLHNVLYFMSDQPQGGIAPPEDEDHAVHLVYTHGSVHRRHLANNPDEISRLKEFNAAPLASYLGRQGVIVIGYSGWNDTTFTALQRCADFQGNLYWCGRESPEDAAKGGLRQEVRDLLEANRNGRFYVSLGNGGADELMHRLHRELIGPVPTIIANPSSLLIRELESIQWPKTGLALIDGLEGIARRRIEQLRDLDAQIITPASPGETRNGLTGSHASTSTSVSWQQHFVAADLAIVKGNFDAAVRHLTAIISAQEVPRERLAFAYLYRGYARSNLQPPDIKGAIADYSQVLDMPDAPAVQKAKALLNRGAARTRLDPGDLTGAIADYSQILDMPEAPAEQKAMALVNRGVDRTQLDPADLKGAIADCSQVLDMPDAPAAQKAMALLNRGAARTQFDPGDLTGAIADYSQILHMPDAPAAQKAIALLNRGAARTRLDPGDLTGAIADYSQILDIPEAPAEQKAAALVNRGVDRTQLDPADLTAAIADYCQVLDMPDAPAEQKAMALVNRGVARTHLDPADLTGAIADYSQVLDVANAQAEHKAGALVNRGIARTRLVPARKLPRQADNSKLELPAWV